MKAARFQPPSLVYFGEFQMGSRDRVVSRSVELEEDVKRGLAR